MIVFGPVPSRRLGRSLGINNVFPKTCSYSCIYCQVGVTTHLSIERKRFYGVEEVVKAVERRVRMLEEAGERIDYITFVPDGEPTLDIDLGREAELIKGLGYRIAILTNGSLLFREDIRNDLMVFDYVCIKVDAGSTPIWKKMNCPHPSLVFEEVIEGIEIFAKSFKGILATETMLVKNVNDSIEVIEATARIVKRISPGIAYIAIPIRPPAQRWVEPSDERSVVRAYNVFREVLGSSTRVELLISRESGSFTSAGNPIEDLLAILSVHPMTKREVLEYLDRYGIPIDIVDKLVAEGKLRKVEYRGETFYVRRIS